MEKHNGKKDLVKSISSRSFKIVFALLAKVILIEISIFIIKVEKLGFKELLVGSSSLILF